MKSRDLLRLKSSQSQRLPSLREAIKKRSARLTYQPVAESPIWLVTQKIFLLSSDRLKI